MNLEAHLAPFTGEAKVRAVYDLAEGLVGDHKRSWARPYTAEELAIDARCFARISELLVELAGGAS